MEVLGPMPDALLRRRTRTGDYFDSKGSSCSRHPNIRDLSPFQKKKKKKKISPRKKNNPKKSRLLIAVARIFQAIFCESQS